MLPAISNDTEVLGSGNSYPPILEWGKLDGISVEVCLKQHGLRLFGRACRSRFKAACCQSFTNTRSQCDAHDGLSTDLLHDQISLEFVQHDARNLLTASL